MVWISGKVLVFTITGDWRRRSVEKH